MTITIIYEGIRETSEIPACTTVNQLMKAVRKFTKAPYQIEFPNGAISKLIKK